MKESATETPLILVFYVEIGDMEAPDIQTHIQTWIDMVNRDEKQKDFIKYFIPTRNQPHSRIECINPTMISSDEHVKIAEAMDKLNAIMSELQKKSVK